MTIYSYSRVGTYFNCPLQFNFRYIEKRKSPVAEGIELFLGSRFHETMEFLYREVPRRVPTVNEVLDHFKKIWQADLQEAVQVQQKRGFPGPLRITNEGQTLSDYFQKGQLFVENYYHQYHPFDQDETVGIEQKVTFDLDPKGQYKMLGYIDRVARDPEGTLWIHDYKTSSRKMGEEDARNEDQLALYQLGLAQNPAFGPKEKIKLVWHFVAFEKDRVVSERSPKELESLRKRYVAKIQAIEKAKDYPPKTGPLCQWCEFMTVCDEGRVYVEGRLKRKAEAAAAKNGTAVEPKAGLPDPVRLPEPEAVPAALPASASVPAPTKKRKKAPGVRSSDQMDLFSSI